jgi:hypothetical protein
VDLLAMFSRHERTHLSQLSYWVARKSKKIADPRPPATLQEICAHVAAPDGPHPVGTRHSGSEDEIDAGPQGTEKQVSLANLACGISES